MYKSTNIERMLFTPEKRILVRIIDHLVLSFLFAIFVYNLNIPFGNQDYSKIPPDMIIPAFIALLLTLYIVVFSISTFISSLNIKLSAYYIIDLETKQNLYIIKRINKDQVLLSESNLLWFNSNPEYYLFRNYEDVVKEKILIKQLKLKDNFPLVLLKEQRKMS